VANGRKSLYVSQEEIILDISIIIISWNTAGLLKDCLDSILRSPAACEREIIVVDNASHDGSPEMVETDFPSVKLIRNPENYGFAKANNIGIKAAAGKYVCLANSDTLIRDDCLDKLCAYLDSHPDIAVLGPKLLWTDLTLQWSCRKFPTLWNTLCPALGLTRLFPRAACFSGEHMGYFKHDRVIEADALVGAFLMVRQAAIDAIGLMDENYFFYCEEIDWCKRFKNAGWKVVFFPDAQVVHLGQGSASKEPDRFKREYMLSNVRYWKKHHNGLERFIFCLIVLCRHSIRLAINSFLYIMIPSVREKTARALKNSITTIKTLVTVGRCVD
jgi:hypothetical protein